MTHNKVCNKIKIKYINSMFKVVRYYTKYKKNWILHKKKLNLKSQKKSFNFKLEKY